MGSPPRKALSAGGGWGLATWGRCGGVRYFWVGCRFCGPRGRRLYSRTSELCWRCWWWLEEVGCTQELEGSSSMTLQER